MKDNIISFEEFYRKKEDAESRENGYAKSFFQELQKQPKLLDWLTCQKKFNRHLLFLSALFRENQVLEQNPDVGFFVGFTKEQMASHAMNIASAVTSLDREPLVLDAPSGTYIDLAEKMTAVRYSDDVDAKEGIRNVLRSSHRVFIIKEISKLQTDNNRAHLARHMIKARDDAHSPPNSELIFVDYGAFLQKAWEHIGIYITIMA